MTTKLDSSETTYFGGLFLDFLTFRVYNIESSLNKYRTKNLNLKDVYLSACPDIILQDFWKQPEVGGRVYIVGSDRLADGNVLKMNIQALQFCTCLL